MDTRYKEQSLVTRFLVRTINNERTLVDSHTGRCIRSITDIEHTEFCRDGIAFLNNCTGLYPRAEVPSHARENYNAEAHVCNACGAETNEASRPEWDLSHPGFATSVVLCRKCGHTWSLELLVMKVQR